MKTVQRWQQLRPSFIREILQASQQDNIISMAGGLPAEELLPVSQLKDHIQQLTDYPSLFQYGSSDGLPMLRQTLRSRYKIEDHCDLLITSGSQQGLDIIARTYLDNDTAIALEAPCYLGALQVFQLSETKIYTIDQLDTGPDLNQLESLFKNQVIKLFYAVPDFHNPTGVCWSRESRDSVIRLCRKYGVFLLEDAPYRELRFQGNQLPSLASLAPDITLQLRSFSKTVLPGIRLGAIIGQRQLINELQRTRQAMDLHSPTPFQQVLAKFLSSQAYDDHLQFLRQAYSERYHALSQALNSHFTGEAVHNPVEGGMFLWLKLSDNSEPFALSALKQGVATVPGCHFYPDKRVSSMLRLNFSHSAPDLLAEAVLRLSDCYADHIKKGP